MQRLNCFMVTLVLLVSTFPHFSADELILKEKWEHKDEILAKIGGSYVDADGDVIICIYRKGLHLITEKKVTQFAPFGQGNNQIANLLGLDGHPDTKKNGNSVLACLERVDRIKIFEKKEGAYVETGVKWIKRSQYPHFIQDMTYFDNKLFLAGRCLLNYDPNITKQAYLRVLNAKGEQISTLLYEELKTEEDTKSLYIVYFIIANPSRNELYFMSECDLKIDIISPVELKVKDTVKLEKPKNYKAMPAHFYQDPKVPMAHIEELKKVETWKTSYSRITRAFLYRDFLVLQVVNCGKNEKNYSLLFFKGKDFKLEKVIPIDDLLLGVHGDNLYFFAGGNPGYIDGVETIGINIYQYRPLEKK